MTFQQGCALAVAIIFFMLLTVLRFPDMTTSIMLGIIKPLLGKPPSNDP